VEQQKDPEEKAWQLLLELELEVPRTWLLPRRPQRPYLCNIISFSFIFHMFCVWWQNVSPSEAFSEGCTLMEKSKFTEALSCITMACDLLVQVLKKLLRCVALLLIS
jgi:hypothetical protein